MNYTNRSATLRVVLLGLCLLAFVAMGVSAGLANPAKSPEKVLEIFATVATQPVPHGGDAADDVAIWVHPTNRAESTIIGTDKHGGLAVYDLAGKQIQYLPDGEMNNVDLRSDFLLSGQKVTLVTAGNRADNSLAIYRVNQTSRLLENVAARRIIVLDVYGLCMYHSQKTGKFYSFVNSKTGAVEQWELFDDGKGKVDGKKVRGFKVGSQTEGCVADDELGHLYISEEKVGIWKYGAEADASTSRTQVDRTGAGGHLVPDVEGLTIAYEKNGTGYLIASSQGNSTYVLYRRERDNQYVRTFRIIGGNGIDGTSDTDGIDVTTANLGPAFPHGVFVAQDGHNNDGNQNFKLVPWELIISESSQFTREASAGSAQPLTAQRSAGRDLVGSGTCGSGSSTESLRFKQARLRLDPDPHEGELSVRGTFVAPVNSIDPPREGVTVGIRHGETLIGCFRIPAGTEGWRTSRGPKWEFRDKRDRSLGDPPVSEKVRIKFNAEKKRFELKVAIKRAQLMDPQFLRDARAVSLSTSVIIGDEEFLNTQTWRATAGGTKLIAP